MVFFHLLVFITILFLESRAEDDTVCYTIWVKSKQLQTKVKFIARGKKLNLYRVPNSETGLNVFNRTHTSPHIEKYKSTLVKMKQQ